MICCLYPINTSLSIIICLERDIYLHVFIFTHTQVHTLMSLDVPMCDTDTPTLKFKKIGGHDTLGIRFNFYLFISSYEEIRL